MAFDVRRKRSMSDFGNNFKMAEKKAREGVKIMSDLESKYLQNDQLMLILPSQSKEEDKFALKYLPDYMKKNKLKKCVIITVNSEIKTRIDKVKDLVENVVVIRENELQCLAKLYGMYIPYKSMVWGCIEYIDGRRGSKILGKKNITVEDLIRYGVYNLDLEK